MNPWDIPALLTAKHAQHVVLIHFPIALFLAGVGFDLVATITRRREWALAACYNLIFAAVSAVPAALTGLLAWQWELEGRRLKGILLLHLIFGASSALLILIVAWIHGRSHRPPDSHLPSMRWPVQALAVILVILTGHLGGFLSGVNHP